MTNPTGPDYFTQWCSGTDRKLDLLNTKLDDMQQQSIDLWQKQHDSTESLRQEVSVIRTNYGERLAALQAELGMWRWALVISIGLVLTSVMQMALNQSPIAPKFQGDIRR